MNSEDVQQLPRLHATSSDTAAQQERARVALTQLFPRLYFEHPWSENGIRSLVNEDGEGRINGMMGVVVRPMRLGDRPVRMAVCSELFVEPASRSQMIGLQLVRTFLNGPQDLSFSDISNEKSRKIWERLGGAVVPLYNINWFRPLRPAQFLLELGQEHRWARNLRWGAAPLATLVDKLAARAAAIPRVSRIGPIRPIGRTQLKAEPLTPGLFLEHFTDSMPPNQLYPVHSAASIAWTWSRLDYVCREAGPSHQIAVQGGRGELVGWYIYQVRPKRIGKVAQIVARSGSIDDVLEHLFQVAREQGAVGLMGRLQPQYLQAFGDAGCLFRARRTYTLAHSKDPELLKPLQHGTAFLTLLEGEACLDIWNEPERGLAALSPGINTIPTKAAVQSEKCKVQSAE